jgi:hypothetical protein
MQSIGFEFPETEMEFKEVIVTGQLPPGVEPREGMVI